MGERKKRRAVDVDESRRRQAEARWRRMRPATAAEVDRYELDQRWREADRG